MRTFKIDLDYESYLFNPQYDEFSSATLKVVREFEYVFFLINKEKCFLKNVRSYDEPYLNNLRSLGFTIPQFYSGESRFDYWWGLRKHIELERTLNSKLTSAIIARENKWGFWKGALVSNIHEVRTHLENYPETKFWIIKRPHGFSGIGHYYFEADKLDEKALAKILVEIVLLEPSYKRIFDLGTTFEIENGIVKRQFMVENFNSPSGGFKGGAGASDVDKFKKYINKKYNFPLDELEMMTQKILKEYLSLGASSNVQIDSFVYDDAGELKLYPLVEVNYRKSMGLVIQSLADRHPDVEYIEWRVLKQKEVMENLEQWIKISPEGNHFRSFYKCFHGF